MIRNNKYRKNFQNNFDLISKFEQRKIINYNKAKPEFIKY